MNLSDCSRKEEDYVLSFPHVPGLRSFRVCARSGSALVPGLRSFRVCARSGSALVLCGRTLLLLIGFLSLLGLTAPPAQAGHYKATIVSNGTCYTDGYPSSVPYWYDYEYCAGPIPYNPEGNTFECWSDSINTWSYNVNAWQASGQIEVKFDWQPDPGKTLATDPPPTSVIVREDSEASWWAPGNTGQCDDDLGGDEDTLTQYSDGSWSGDMGGTRYSIQGGQTLDVWCAPYADAGDVSGSASADYFIALFPVTIDLTGTTGDSNGADNILIGQGCTARLNGIPDSYTVSNFQWTVPDPVFNSFIVADDDSYGYVHNIFGDEWEKPSPHWHWSKDETATVSCTAQVSLDNQVIGTVSGQKQVKVWAPYYYFGNDTGGVFINPYSTGIWQLKAGRLPHESPRGSNWQGQVTTPDLFTNNGYGAWHFVQIITPGRSKTLTNGGSLNCTENGNVGLDTSYPYPVGDSSDPFLALLNGWSADDELHVTGDSPSTGLDDTIANVNIDESFDVYMMYLPPNSDSQWVPLHKFQWYWYADDAIPGVSWTNWIPGSYAGFVARSSSKRCYDHPFWQKLEGVFVGSGW